jgi:hypothetical protein
MHDMPKSLRALGVAAALASGALWAGCGNSQASCGASCVAVGGSWSLVIDTFTATGGCTWYNTTGSTPLAIDQSADGALVTVSFQITDLIDTTPISSTLTASGTLLQDQSVNATSPVHQTEFSTTDIRRIDSLQMAFAGGGSAGANAFTGTWSTEETETANATATPDSCVRTATIHGTKL